MFQTLWRIFQVLRCNCGAVVSLLLCLEYMWVECQYIITEQNTSILQSAFISNYTDSTRLTSLGLKSFDWGYILVIVGIIGFLLIGCGIAMCCARQCGVNSTPEENDQQGFTNAVAAEEGELPDKPPAYYDVPHVDPPPYHSLQGLHNS